MSEVKLDDIVSLAKRRGFIYQGSEIYGGLAGTYDYGPLGTALKRNLANLWWKKFVQERDDMYGLDAAIIMSHKVWEASGHVAGFTDPLVECSNCHSRVRADHVQDNKCPVCGKTGTFGEPREFNLLFPVTMGAVAEDGATGYLRGETAQGIFVNFKNVMDSFYPDLPFGIAQIGKAFRNEIAPRDFLFRLREMDQMEIEYFVKSNEWEKHFEHWQKQIHEFLKLVGVDQGTHEHEIPEKDRAHYSKRTIDFEFDYPFGRSELLGLAYRTDYDLQNHQKASGKSMEYRPKDNSAPFVPHVIEPSFGLDRLLLAVLCASYAEDEQGGEKRAYLKLPAHLAPVKVAVCPLAKNKPELVAKAREVYKTLQKEVGNVMWLDTGNIGKNYRRADEIGVPKFITVDFQTLDDETVTIRDRDTTEQQRVKIGEIRDGLV